MGSSERLRRRDALLRRFEYPLANQIFVHKIHVAVENTVTCLALIVVEFSFTQLVGQVRIP